MTRNEIKEYYDSFSNVYDRRVGDVYHEMIDDMEVKLIRQYGEDKRILECGCGTGIILERVKEFAPSAKGIDLSTGMVERSITRGLDVEEGSVTNIPFPDNTFDVAYSVKVLAHVEDINKAIEEMTRVIVPGGYVIAEFYNSYSIRELVRKLRPGISTAKGKSDKDVYYRSDAPSVVRSYISKHLTLVEENGFRVITVFPSLLKLPYVGKLFQKIEHSLANKLPRLGGFYCVVARKDK